MFGIPDFGVWSAYLLCILSTILCVVYGVMHWNKGAENESQQVNEEKIWEKVEEEISSKL